MRTFKGLEKKQQVRERAQKRSLYRVKEIATPGKTSDDLSHAGGVPEDWSSYKSIVAEVASLRDEVLVLRQGLTVSRAPDVPRVILPELHDENTGRIDAQKVADFMGVPLKPLAEGLGLNYKAVHRNPSASGFQEALRPVKRSLEILHEFFGPKETIRVWLNTPHPDLDGATSLDTILEGKAFAVSRILGSAWNGVPL